MKLLLSFSNIKNLKDFDLVVANSNVRCKETDLFFTSILLKLTRKRYLVFMKNL